MSTYTEGAHEEFEYLFGFWTRATRSLAIDPEAHQAPFEEVVEEEGFFFREGGGCE